MAENWTFENLARAERTKYEQLLREAPAPPFESLVGWEFRGYNRLAPIAKLPAQAAGFQRFIKLFFRRAGDPDPQQADVIHGCNKMVERGSLFDPWTPRKKRGREVHHGFYTVYRPGHGPRFGPYAQSAFLDYNRPENGLFDGRRVLYDFLVQVTDDLLLGKAYIRLRIIPRVRVSYFMLERLKQHSFIR